MNRPCPDRQEAIADYVLGALDAPQAEVLQEHLNGCDHCRRYCESLRDQGEALVRLGVEHPTLAVAGLNPHSGEHGLFGDEEAREIEPAVAEAKARGLAVSGPVPADSVFHLAKMGRFDAVISLYHDQGHIAAKTLDFERTVSVTCGLPFLRTSVDHGTALDIAGKGVASSVSMEEAIAVAAQYAGRVNVVSPKRG